VGLVGKQNATNYLGVSVIPVDNFLLAVQIIIIIIIIIIITYYLLIH